MATEMERESISALASLPVGILQSIVEKLDHPSLRNLIRSLGKELSVNQWTMINNNHTSRHALSKLPHEIYLQMALNMESESIHALIHTLRPSIDILDLVKLALYKQASRELMTPLMTWAADIGCVSCFNIFKDNESHTIRTYRGFNPLLSACHKGHEEIVWLLLTEYGYTNIRTMGSNETALILASDGGYSGIVQMLMACNADIDEVDWNDRTPLSVATTRGHIDIIRLLLDAGADVHTHHGPRFGSLLDIAVDCGYAEALRLLLRAGAEPVHTGTNSRRLSTLERAVGFKGHKYMEYLMINGAKHPKFKLPPITVEGAAKTRLEMVTLLCQYGIDLNTVYGPRNTAVIHVAASNLAGNIVKVLCGQNVGMINTLDSAGCSSLHLAALKATCVKDLETFEALLKNGIDWTIRDNAGRTAMDCVPARLWCSAYSILAARICWDEDVGNWFARYTWYGFYWWVKESWVQPIVLVLERDYPIQYEWVKSFISGIPKSAVYLSLVSILHAIWTSLPVRFLRSLVRGITGIVKPVIVSHLDDIRGLSHRFLTSNFNTRFFWKLFYFSVVGMHLVVLLGLQLGGGSKSRANVHERGGGNGVSPRSAISMLFEYTIWGLLGLFLRAVWVAI